MAVAAIVTEPAALTEEFRSVTCWRVCFVNSSATNWLVSWVPEFSIVMYCVSAASGLTVKPSESPVT